MEEVVAFQTDLYIWKIAVVNCCELLWQLLDENTNCERGSCVVNELKHCVFWISTRTEASGKSSFLFNNQAFFFNDHYFWIFTWMLIWKIRLAPLPKRFRIFLYIHTINYLHSFFLFSSTTKFCCFLNFLIWNKSGTLHALFFVLGPFCILYQNEAEDLLNLSIEKCNKNTFRVLKYIWAFLDTPI